LFNSNKNGAEAKHGYLEKIRPESDQRHAFDVFCSKVAAAMKPQISRSVALFKESDQAMLSLV
jgi:hypothetical protein